jgi:peptidoglycan/xylan/chitin deacetylase (PgdA/CDA1 family)
VTTGFIGTDRVPDWDRRMNIDTRWMSWDQVRALRRAGHEIGSHTANHVDLGITHGSLARDEIKSGKDRVEAELSEPSKLFAYPFGGKNQMTEQNLSLVRQLGLRCCVSAYGGTVHADDDPLRLRRTTISKWFISPYQFGFELVSGRLEPR